MENLFRELRQACSSTTWSQGVELVRANAVTLEQKSDEEIELRVTPPNGIVGHQVLLYPMDEDWSCECPSNADACEHAAAAIIAYRRGELGDSKNAPAHETVARIHYHLRVVGNTVEFQRALVFPDGQSHPLEGTLTRAAAPSSGYPRFTTTQTDLQIEHTLGTQKRGALPRALFQKLFPLLKNCDFVFLEDSPIRIGGQTCGMNGWLEDHPEGYWLQIAQDKSIDVIYSNGILKANNTLFVLTDTGLTAKDLKTYRAGLILRKSDIAELTNTHLPRLESIMNIQVRTQHLPGRSRALPRILVQTERQQDALIILPTIVYGDPPVARVDGERLVHLQGNVPIRQKAHEAELTRKLRTDLGLTPGIRSRFPREEGVRIAEELGSWRGEIQGDAHRWFRLVPALRPQFNDSSALPVDFVGDRFDSSNRIHQGKSAGGASVQSVVNAWQKGENLAPLEGGGWAPIPVQWLEKHGRLLLDLLAAQGEKKALPQAAISDLARLHESLDQPPPPEYQAIRDQLESFSSIPTASLSSQLSQILRDYQTQGVNWLEFLRTLGVGALLADDMGLGKTLQTLCVLNKSSLVVCPTSVLPNWENEIQRFRSELTINIFHGPSRQLTPDADITLTTYAILRNDCEALKKQDWDTIVLDEAQAIKNPDSLVAQAAYSMKANYKIAMTGTPIENRLEELWSQFHFTNPGYLGGRSDFQRRYAKPISSGDEAIAAHLRKRIRPFVLRRLKEEVASELPARTDIELYCSLSENEQAIYNALRMATRKDLLEKLSAGGNVMAAFEALLRLRQVACHSGLIPGTVAESSSKVDLLLETLEPITAANHKSLVFSQWTSLLDRIEPHLQEKEITFVRLDGSTRNRGDVVSQFQNPNGPKVMLISLKAGGTGLNLTAADHVFLMDPWWNPAVEEQAADRAHRIGQENPVFVHRLIAKNTVEEKIIALQAEKRKLADLTLAATGQKAGITRDELLELLS